MSDFAIISDLSINVDEIQKDGSFYEIAGTFVVEGNAESLVKARCFSSKDLTVLPSPLILDVKGRFKYVQSDDPEEASTLNVESTEEPTVQRPEDPQQPPLVFLVATTAKQSGINVLLNSNTYWNKNEGVITFDIEAILPQKRYTTFPPPALTGQMICLYGRLVKPRTIVVGDFSRKILPKERNQSSPFSKTPSTTRPSQKKIIKSHVGFFKDTPTSVSSVQTSPSQASVSSSTSSSSQSADDNPIHLDFTNNVDEDEIEIVTPKKKRAREPVSPLPSPSPSNRNTKPKRH